MPRRRRLPASPRLTARTVEDNEQLAAAVDELLRTDSDLAQLAVDLTLAQSRLRQVVGGEAWKVYLALDELVTARLADSTVKIARWAFQQGQRSGGRRQR